MTEREWLECEDPEPLLWHLRAADFPRRAAGRRKLRLLGCACVRREWRRATDPRSRALVAVAERYADGLAGKSELTAAERAALEAREGGRGLVVVGAAARSHPRRWCKFLQLSDRVHPQPAWEFALVATLIPRVVRATDARGPQEEAQAALVRDVFGNPFRAATPAPVHRTPTVVSLARSAYEQRELPSGHLNPARLAVLSDALEEAGCTDADLLDHLRSPVPHVRGCWAVDLLTGRS